ncbi:Peptidase M16 inactive domain protein [Labrenzia sp. THAF35]|uniref:M16 family metallopeptidase n=1 Tax=Labrenzia sp. THAF35 TaxID=2587854 RepID=UPI0012A94110|nr:pitrilysin family protein [Labrenzia sp. THAF35]QFT65322.1 Peptidase M16 inactive domain protein [Labrenzia sp. THAF35]
MAHTLFSLRGPVSALALSLVALLGLMRLAQAVEIQEVTSPKGITAWLVEDHTVPIVALDFSFDGGSAQDPVGKEGLTRLLAATLDEGAGEMDSETFQAKLEELAISINFSTGKDRFYGSLRTLTPTLDDASDLLALAVNEPRFDEAPVERMKAQLSQRARRNESDPDAIAGRALAEAMFGDHPYARPTLGTAETLAGLNADDLANQKGKLLARKGLIIGVVGAVDAETLAGILDKVFAPLQEEGQLVQIADFEPEFGTGVNQQLAVPQTTILLGLPGLTRDDPDYQAAFVMNHILGGGTFTSWMYEEVREKRGLSYGAGTSLSPYAHTGLLIANAATKADRADETVKIMLEQISRMAETGPSEDELQSAKQYLTGSYPLRFDSSGKIARQLVALQNAELGIDYFDRRNSEIEAISLDDVKRVAKRLLADKAPTVVTVGPKQG